MSEQIRCFFIGHRDAPDNIYQNLRQAVENHIVQYGVTEFIVGNYGSFDCLAARAVGEAKKLYPEVLLTMLMPYYPTERKIDVPVIFDGSWYPPKMETVPKRAAIVRANRCAVDHVQYLIAYVRHPASNARELAEYARSRIVVTNL